MGEEVNLIMEPEDLEMQFTPVLKEEETKEEQPKRGRAKVKKEVDESGLINCLRKELITVQIVPKHIKWVNDKNHPYSGGKADGTVSVYTVPRLRNGELKNPLTKAEKEFLEDYMGLEPNALSIHKPAQNNYWINRQVIVQKEGTVLDLSTPVGYINYKILLMNSDLICPSLEDLRLMPKATYQYVLVSSEEKFNVSQDRVSTKSKCWKEYGKIETKANVLKAIIEALDGTRVDGDVAIETLQGLTIDLLEANPKEFLRTITDPLLEFKAILNEAVENNIVENRGGYHYYNNTPLCGKDENPTTTVAARYIANPRNQELLFSIQAKLK